MDALLEDPERIGRTRLEPNDWARDDGPRWNGRFD
jgi:hypothetical protein